MTTGKKCSHCERQARAHGLCGTHESRLRRGQSLDDPPKFKCAGKTCFVEGCSRPAEKKLMCRNHYANAKRAYLIKCSVSDCENKEGFGRKGLCNKHYLAKYRRENARLCAHCQRPSIAKGMCAAHYSRAKRGVSAAQPLGIRYNGQLCSQPDCANPARGLGLCKFHYSRQREGVPLDAPPRAPTLRSFINTWGYVTTVCADGKYRQAHRMVMAEHIGRELLRHETVHHKNGVRTDNRLSNLELWTKHQPNGQRVVDKVDWAREILDIYGDLFPEKPRRSKRGTSVEQLPLKIA